MPTIKPKGNKPPITALVCQKCGDNFDDREGWRLCQECRKIHAREIQGSKDLRIKPNPGHIEAMIAYQCAVPDENLDSTLIECFKLFGYKKTGEIFYADTSKRIIRLSKVNV